MAISGVSSAAASLKSAVSTTSKNQAKLNYFTRINEQFKSKNMRLKQGTYFSHQTFDVTQDDKPHVVISDELIEKASQDPETAKLLEKKISEVTDAYKWLGTHLKKSDRSLTECVFSIDKKGVISCSGKVKKGDDITDFSLPLCKVTDKNADLTTRLTIDFEFKGFHIIDIKI